MAAVPRPAEAARPRVAPVGEVRPLHTVEQSSPGPLGERLAAHKAVFGLRSIMRLPCRADTNAAMRYRAPAGVIDPRQRNPPAKP